MAIVRIGYTKKPFATGGGAKGHDYGNGHKPNLAILACAVLSEISFVLPRFRSDSRRGRYALFVGLLNQCGGFVISTDLRKRKRQGSLEGDTLRLCLEVP
ncbi:hypothetical protein VI817_004715 [Penicillium citrinum]|nr:hypothetical protein VI817_004715 [Penicillium citrinum]